VPPKLATVISELPTPPALIVGIVLPPKARVPGGGATFTVTIPDTLGAGMAEAKVTLKSLSTGTGMA